PYPSRTLMPNCFWNTSITSLLSGSPAETALCNWSRLTFFSFSDLAINRYSVGVQQSTLIASSSIRPKYVSGLNRPLYIKPIAPEPSVASNGLHTHFCHPGAAVAHTLSVLEMPSQLAATVRKCAYPHA